MQTLPLAFQRNGIRDELGSQDLAQTPGQRHHRITALRIGHEDGARLLRLIHQFEADVRLGHRKTFHDIRHRARLRLIGPKELQPCRRRIEQVAQFDRRASLHRGRSRCTDFSARGGDLQRFAARNPRRQRQSRHRCEGRQRLAPEPERVDIQKIRSVDFRCGMA